MNVRSIACFAAVLTAAVLALPLTTGAQQSVQVAQAKRPPAPLVQQTPSARYAARRDKLNQNTVTVVSGNPNGTYLYLAYDLSAVLDDGDDLRVLPVIGKGGYQNMMDVLHLRGVDLGITQSNIMSYLKKTGEFGPNIENRVAYITKLYNEEMHVLAGPGINRIQDLTGKKVNFSDVGSGTQFSTRLIFELLGIKAEEVNMGQADGYQKVKSGELAATVLIAGKPTGSFSKFKLEPGMTLLPVPYTEVLEQDYFPARLTHEDYPALIAKGGSVDTVAIASVLAAYNWARDTDRYRRVAAFIDAFFAKFPEFQKGARHAKWKETNLNSVLRGWKRFPAAEEWLARNADRPSTAANASIDPGVVRAQAAKAAPNDPAAQERLFQEFMEWAKSQGRR
ncbi:MAG: TAXI family TRAP transporter solute-binding subunit [Rhodospirillales bacterium]|nr:TAXI family TRAP transporter solute-binding subunit [Rhodospirillales bacterium]